MSPIPKPSVKESRTAYIARCMGDKLMSEEYPREQRLAVCFSTWRKYGSVGERGGTRSGPRKRPIRPIYVKGHYSHRNDKRVWVKPYTKVNRNGI